MYLWLALTRHHGAAFGPRSFGDVMPFLRECAHQITIGAAPSPHAAAIYFGFLAFELVLAYVMPGVRVQGLPVPSENGARATRISATAP